MLRAKASVSFAVELLKLSEFFFERHSRQDRIDSIFDVSLSDLGGNGQDGKAKRED